MKSRRLAFLAVLIAVATLCTAQDLTSFEKRTTVKKLPNGLTVVISERPEAPVFSFFTQVDAGSVQDPKAKPDSRTCSSTWPSRGRTRSARKIIPPRKSRSQKWRKSTLQYIDERDKRVGRDDAKVKELEAAWQAATKDANQYVIPNQFPQIIESNGGEGMNASTSYDQTEYFYSFPENRLELWAYLESERFLHPVMREFYKERNVVIEERRMRVDSNPVGQLLEQFVTAAFQAHPYHRPTIGWPSDLNTFSATDAAEFFR